MGLRFKLPLGTGDVPPAVAARHMGRTLEAFMAELPELVARGFPPADPTTGNFDLDAINVWRRARYPHLFGDRLTAAPLARNAKDVVGARVARMGSG
jgi:hypothetical protein